MSYDHRGRLARLLAEMQRRGIQSVLLSVGSDLPYLTGYEAMATERLTMLVVTQDRDPVLVIPALEAPRVEPGPFEVRAWTETEEPEAIVADLAGRPDVAAVGDQTWSRFLLELLPIMTETTFVSASGLMGELRMRKEPSEVQALREVAAAADRVAERIPTTISFTGRTEREVAGDLDELMRDEGHEETLFRIVAGGPNAASPHHEPGSRRLGDGDAVVIDFGGRRSGYCSDTTRTFVVGETFGELAGVHATVLEANLAAKAAVGPGVPAEEVDRTARAVIEGEGYGEFFIHRTGHGIGMDVHEDPYIVEGNHRTLEVGMAFSIEPGIYLPGRFGVRIEDICVCTEDGIEVLNDSHRGLVEVG